MTEPDGTRVRKENEREATEPYTLFRSVLVSYSLTVL